MRSIKECCGNEKETEAISIDIGEGRKLFSILMQSIVLYDLIVGNEVRGRFEVTLSKSKRIDEFHCRESTFLQITCRDPLKKNWVVFSLLLVSSASFSVSVPVN